MEKNLNNVQIGIRHHQCLKNNCASLHRLHSDGSLFFLNITFCVQKGQIDSQKNCKQLKNYVQILRLIFNVQCEICPPKFWTEAICLCIFVLLKLLGIEKFATSIFFYRFYGYRIVYFYGYFVMQARTACLSIDTKFVQILWGLQEDRGRCCSDFKLTNFSVKLHEKILDPYFGFFFTGPSFR